MCYIVAVKTHDLIFLLLFGLKLSRYPKIILLLLVLVLVLVLLLLPCHYFLFTNTPTLGHVHHVCYRLFFNSCYTAIVESKSFSDITMQATEGFKIFGVF